jgi:alkyldihydroxyacetonephosphate synthase
MDVEALRRSGLRVSADELDTESYRRDLWPRDTLRMYRQDRLPDAPRAVTWPENEEQVATAMDWAQQQGAAIVPYGAGSGVCGGAAGLEGSLVIDTKRMRRILEVDTDARTVHTQTGLIGQHLEDALGAAGWMTAHSPSSIMCSTVGGYVAARSAGQFSSRYGVFSDMLLAARAVTPSGLLTTGRWTAPGETDLQPVLCGSEGTLGIVTEALMRMVPVPETRRFHGYAFPDLGRAWTAMQSIMQAGLWPCALRLYDPVDTRIGGRAKAGSDGPSLFGQLKRAVQSIPGLQRHALDLPLALPGLVNRLAAGLGKEVLLIVGFEGHLDEVDRAFEATKPMLERARSLGEEPGKHWFAHRHDVSYKLAPVFISGGFADTCEVAATWDRLPDLYQEVRTAIARHGVVMAHFSHAYPEGCSIYFSFAGRGRVDTYDRLWADALEAAAEAGGTVTHHHGVGQLKALAATVEMGAAAPLWADIRRRWDPDGMMNPGRLVVEGVDVSDGPPTPTDPQPVITIDATSRLARVHGGASVIEISAQLGAAGWRLSVPPDDTSYARWLPGLSPVLDARWTEPMFGIQVRLPDGRSTVLGRAPRSAAGPDLRWAALQCGTLEWVDVPIQPAHQDTHIASLGVDGDHR